MKYAVIRINGRQYKVSEGEDVLVDKTDSLEAEVLLTVDGEKVSVGTPLVKGATVKLSKVEDSRGEKVDVFKYKSKSRYRKHTGFRAEHSQLHVEKISA